MEYTEADIRQAFLTDELARIRVGKHGMFAFTGSRVPTYGTAVPDPELTTAAWMTSP